jgi:hypothetical protein
VSTIEQLKNHFSTSSLITTPHSKPHPVLKETPPQFLNPLSSSHANPENQTRSILHLRNYSSYRHYQPGRFEYFDLQTKQGQPSALVAILHPRIHRLSILRIHRSFDMTTLVPMASPVRQPFGNVDQPRLRNLANMKNRQYGKQSLLMF